MPLRIRERERETTGCRVRWEGRKGRNSHRTFACGSRTVTAFYFARRGGDSGGGGRTRTTTTTTTTRRRPCGRRRRRCGHRRTKHVFVFFFRLLLMILLVDDDNLLLGCGWCFFGLSGFVRHRSCCRSVYYGLQYNIVEYYSNLKPQLKMRWYYLGTTWYSRRTKKKTKQVLFFKRKNKKQSTVSPTPAKVRMAYTF